MEFDVVQDYYAQELMTPADRKAMLEQYKKKIYGQFYSRSGMPRDPSNSELRNILAEFEQVSVVPADVVELFLYRVEMAVEFANDFGGMPEGDYNTALTAFKKCLKIICEHKLEPYFKERCRTITAGKENYDYYFREGLNDLYFEFLG